MTRAFLENKWVIFLGLMFALLMQPLAPMIKHLYQTSTPVVDMRGEIVEKTDDSVLLHIYGRKLRECEFVRITAFTATKNGELRDAILERVGGKPQDGATKPIGSHDLGLWTIRPVAGSTRASVFVQHECSGELLLSRIADVDLTKPTK